MGKAGGIIGLIAGVFAVIAALMTLVVGGVGAAFSAGSAGTIVTLGWGGLSASFLVIVFGAVAIFKPTVGAFGLLALSIIGVAVGGTMVAICLVLAFLAGVLAAIGSKAATGKRAYWPWAGVPLGIMVAVALAISTQEKPADTTASSAKLQAPAKGGAPVAEQAPAMPPAPSIPESVQSLANSASPQQVCAAGRVQQTAREIAVWEAFTPDQRRDIDQATGLRLVEIRNATPTHFDHDLQKTSCSAQLVVDSSAGADESLMQAVSYQLARTPDVELALASKFTGPAGARRFQMNLSYSALPDTKGGWSVQAGSESAIEQIVLYAILKQAKAATDRSPTPNTAMPAEPTKIEAVEPVAAAHSTPASPMPSAEVQRPGWCNKAGTEVERMICADDGLSALDAKMYAAYKAAEASAADKKAFYAVSRGWRIDRRDACTSVPCIADAYKERLSELGG